MTTLIDSNDGINLMKINLMTTTKKGKMLRPWLGLQKTPKTNQEMKFFCLLTTASKEDIKTEYMRKKKSKNDTWIKKLASFIAELKTFKWSNSFDDLPDAGADQPDCILLWLADDAFEKNFFPLRKVHE